MELFLVCIETCLVGISVYAKEMTEKLLTIGEVAKILRVSTNTIRIWANKGMFHVYCLGPRGDRRFTQADVDDFLNRKWDHDRD